MTIPRQWTDADYLDLWRRLFPRAYTRPMEEESGGEGLDTVAAYSAIFARVDEAIRETTQRYYLKPHTLQQSAPASGPASAVATLDLERSGDASFDIELVQGTTVVVVYRDTRGEYREGLQFVVSEATTLPAGTPSVSLPVRCTQVGYLGNVGPGSISAFVLRGSAVVTDATATGSDTLVTNAGSGDRFHAGQVGQFLAFRSGPNLGTVRRIVDVLGQVATLEGAALAAGAGTAEVLEFEDLGLTVTQGSAASGGLDAWLESIGRDRLVYRQLGESDASFRSRICELPDVVSPLAIMRILHGILTPAGIPWVLKETRDPAGMFGMVLDVSPLDAGGHAFPGGRFAPLTRFFLVCVGLGNAGESGFALDAAAPGYIDNALDAVTPATLTNFFDGRPWTYLGTIGAAWAAVNAARAGGVGFAIALDTTL